MAVILGEFLTLLFFLKYNKYLQVILVQVQIMKFLQYSGKLEYNPLYNSMHQTTVLYLIHTEEK